MKFASIFSTRAPKKFCRILWILPAWSSANCWPFPSRPGLKENINLNFYLHTSLWYLKRFFGASKDRNGPHKTIWGTTKKCKIIFKLYFILNFFWRIWDSVYVNTLPLGRVSRTSFTLQSFENETAEEWVLSNCNSI